jgi:hypothetical protein
MTSTEPLNSSLVTSFGDFKQRFAYCYKDNEFGSLRRRAVELEEYKQSIEQARVRLRARDIDQIKPISFRQAILGQNRQDDQELAQAQGQLVQARESS